MNTNIQQNYHDAIFFATSELNNKQEFYLRPVEFKLLLKLIHYSSNQSNITWSSEQIAKHISVSVGSINNSIQRLRVKGYINTSTYNTKEKIKKRTIFINWDRLSDINSLYLKSIGDTSTKNEEVKPLLTETIKEKITDTIITQPIQSIQEEIKVPEIEEKVYDDSFFPEELKQKTYTPEEYYDIIEYLNSDLYNTKIKKREVAPHKDNMLNNIEITLENEK